MAAKPHITVRLAPSMLHALQFVAERETLAPAELARAILSAELRGYLARNTLQAQCQDAYMAWLRSRGTSPKGAGPADDAGDIDLVDGEEEPAESTRPVEPVGPYGPTGDQSALFDYSEQPPAALQPRADEAARLVDRFTPRGARKGRG